MSSFRLGEKQDPDWSWPITSYLRMSIHVKTKQTDKTIIMKMIWNHPDLNLFMISACPIVNGFGRAATTGIALSSLTKNI